MKNRKDTPSIQFLTDEVISLFSENNVLTQYRDLDLSYKRMIKPMAKGIVDRKIFGSMFSNQCNCGQIKTIGVQCPRCGSTILDEVSAYRRYARIESPVYYCSELKYRKLIPWLASNFKFRWEIHDDFTIDLTNTELNPYVLEICQFIYDKSKDEIIITDDIDNSFECSFEGLLQIMIKHFPDKVSVFSSYINTSILVVPLVMRPPFYSIIRGERELQMHEISVTYQNIIYAIHEHYEPTIQDIKSEADKALFKGILRRYLSKALSNLSGLLKASKENLARQMQSNRLSNSGRCTIVPAPDLKVDEVYIPRHLMYEACREEFVEYLQNYYQCSKEKAENTYKLEANSVEVQRLFEKYIDGDGDTDKGKYVIINRNPSLYKLNMMSCKVKLTNDYTMGIPILLCSPFGGDFDGDTFSFYCVPKKSSDLINEEMNPKNLVYYKKNLNPLFMPSHEIMHGLIIGTKTSMPDEILSFDNLDDAIAYKKTDRKFKYQTIFLLEGKKTTLGRELFSKYFGTNLNSYLDGLDKNLNAKSMIPLYGKLEDFDDRLERIKEIQNLALLITTISGASAPKLSDLYMDVDKKRLNQIKEIEDSDTLSEKEKEVKIRILYEQFVKEESSKVDEGLKLHIEEASRGKLNQLLSVSFSQLNVGPNTKTSVSDTTLVEGLSPRDFERHAIENRGIQDIKQSSVPTSGNFTRQMVFVASPYYYSLENDEKNKGILIKESEAIGRTKLDGTIVGKSKSDDLIRVRSIVSSTTPKEPKITSDMISKVLSYKDHSHIGIEMITSLTESLTQSGLSLKHGGHLFNLDPLSRLIAPEDVTVNLTEDWVILKGRTQDYKYPKSENFILNYSDGDRYKKGEVIGYAFHLATPSYRMDCAIKLCEARKIPPRKKFASNEILISECYAYEDGTINYRSVDGKIKVYVAGREYRYNPQALYLFPDGTKVNKFDRVCTGLLDIREAVNKVRNYETAYYLFKNQFDELLPVLPELVEFMYVLIVRKVENRVSVKKVIDTVHESKSVYTTLAFEDAKKTMRKIGPEGVPFVEDTMTRVMLSLIVNNNII